MTSKNEPSAIGGSFQAGARLAAVEMLVRLIIIRNAYITT